ncbi:MAG: radical SAM family heme chaperone HemW [Myxococcota bacterium]
MSDVGVYLHVPFCERVCPYCDFAVVATRVLQPDDEARYVAALQRELDHRASAFAGRELATIYFGGGTPSLLRPESIATLIESVRARFPGIPREVTLEINPSTVERARLPGFREAGVDRVSVGMQSFDDTTLRRLGRAHRAAEGHATWAAVREAGFGRASLDLIVAAPEQERGGVEADLDAAIACAPEHLSVYELTFEEGTPFARAASDGRLHPIEETLAAEMLETVEARLEAAGYARYEISSYAKRGAEAVHNRRYWQRLPVLGLGMGAVSSEPIGPGQPFGARRHNPRDLDAYWACADGAAAEHEVLDAATARGEAMFLALRTREGVDARAFADTFGAPPRDFFARDVERLLEQALLEETPDGGLRLTPRGRMLSDHVFTSFV